MTSSDTLAEDCNPSDYNEIIGLFPMVTFDDKKSAIHAACSAFPAWSRTPAPARGAILDKISQILTSRLDEIAPVLTRGEGKTLAEAIRIAQEEIIGTVISIICAKDIMMPLKRPTLFLSVCAQVLSQMI